MEVKDLLQGTGSLEISLTVHSIDNMSPLYLSTAGGWLDGSWETRCLSLVPTSDIMITIIIISMNIMQLCRLCLSGNVQKHNHRHPYDQHSHNRKKMIDHFLMIRIVFDYDYVAFL